MQKKYNNQIKNRYNMYRVQNPGGRQGGQEGDLSPCKSPIEEEGGVYPPPFLFIIFNLQKI